MSSDLTEVSVSVSPKEKFQEYLATKNMRLTQEREIFVDEVFSDHEHFDADQLIERLSQRANGRRVSRSTVYRTLTLMEEAGLLRKVARTNDREIYEHDYGYPQHDHFICKKCGEMIEFHNEEISKILESLASEYGFLAEAHRLEVSGICSQCATRRSEGRPRKLDLL